jgi:hypothetical protein
LKYSTKSNELCVKLKSVMNWDCRIYWSCSLSLTVRYISFQTEESNLARKAIKWYTIKMQQGKMMYSLLQITVKHHWYIQGDRKVTQPWHMFYLSKNKLHWNQKTKNNVILSVGNVHHALQCMHSLFSSCLMEPGEELLCHRNSSPDEILLICLAQENHEMYPWTHSGMLSKNEMPGSVRQWTLRELVKKDILAHRLLKDNWRTGASKLQHDITCVGFCIVTAILCVYLSTQIVLDCNHQ